MSSVHKVSSVNHHKPNGVEPKSLTPLEQHVGFFDRDHDGIIALADTYVGLRALKFGIITSAFFAFVLHLSFSYLTWGSLIPDPFLRVKVNLIHKGKHGSDTSTYTSAGDFDSNRFDYNFDRFSSPPHSHMTFREMVTMMFRNAGPYDPFGWSVGTSEWMVTYVLIWPKDPRGMAREDVKAVYDGTLFYELSKK